MKACYHPFASQALTFDNVPPTFGQQLCLIANLINAGSTQPVQAVVLIMQLAIMQYSLFGCAILDNYILRALCHKAPQWYA